MIPMLLVLRVRTGQGRTVRIWLPLLLVWVLFAPLALLALIVLMVLAAVRGTGPWQVPVLMWRLAAGLTGLRVDVRDGRSAFLVKIF